MTITDDIESFLGHCEATGLVENTLRNYRYVFEYMLLPFLKTQGCQRLADIQIDDLEAYLKSDFVQRKTPGTRKRTTGVVKQFFQWAFNQGRILRDPAKRLPLPDNGEEPLPQAPLSQDEVAALIGSLPRETPVQLRNVAIMELLYGCALRISELIGLDVDAIDFTRSMVTVEGKGSKKRQVPLMESAKSALKDWLAVRRSELRGPDHGALLLAKGGARLNKMSIYSWFKKLNLQRGKDAKHLHPHLLRHSLSVHLLQNGTDIRYIQQLLGHENLDTTKIYLRMVPGQLKEDYEGAMVELL